MAVKSDIEIAREAKLKPIADVAAKIGVPAQALVPYGWTKAKLTFDYINQIQGNKDGKLILVTAISPTPAGEGKTTTSVGLGDGLNRIGKKRHHRASRAVARPLLRQQRRRGGRRLRPGCADGRYQPALHRRLPRHNERPQSAVGADRQSYLLGQCPWHRRAPRQLEARARHERSRAALDRQFARRRLERLPAPGRLRHHGRLGSDGDPLPVEGSEGPREPPRQHHRRLYARQEAGPRPRAERPTAP